MFFLVVLVCFFFKQKTAYEMRISDWSSDVCSSDLRRRRGRATGCGRGRAGAFPAPRRASRQARLASDSSDRLRPWREVRPRPRHGAGRARTGISSRRPNRGRATASRRERSEEHTSELQSLMRISYAVFCLKKKNKTILSEHDI